MRSWGWDSHAGISALVRGGRDQRSSPLSLPPSLSLAFSLCHGSTEQKHIWLQARRRARTRKRISGDVHVRDSRTVNQAPVVWAARLRSVRVVCLKDLLSDRVSSRAGGSSHRLGDHPWTCPLNSVLVMCWQLEFSHGRSIYTRGTGEHSLLS